MKFRLPPAFILALTQVTVEGSTFLRNIVLARLIGVEEMGLAVTITIALRGFEMLGDFGLERWLVQVRANQLDRGRGAVHFLQAFKGVLLAIAAMAAAIPLTTVLLPQIDPGVFALAAVAIGIRGFNNCDHRERHREQDFRGTLQVEGGGNLMALLATGPIAIWTRDYSVVAWASIVQALSMCLISHFVARRCITFKFDRDVIAQALRFGVPISCNAVLMFFAIQGDRMIVAIHFQPEVLAGFALAVQLTLLPTLAASRFISGFDLPRFARIAGQRGAWQAPLRSRLWQVAAVSAGMVLAFCVLGQGLVVFLYGQDFVTEPKVIGFLALAAGFRLIRTVPSTMLVAMGRTSVLLAGNIPRIIALFVVTWALTRGADLFAVALIGAVSEAAGLIIGLAALKSTDQPRLAMMHSTAGAP